MRQKSRDAVFRPVSLSVLAAGIVASALSFSAVLTSISVSQNKGAQFCAAAGSLVVETMSGACPLAFAPVLAEAGRWLIVVGPVVAAPLILLLAMRAACRSVHRIFRARSSKGVAGA